MTDVDRLANQPMSLGEVEQLRSIVQNYPVCSGDLICKQARDVLLRRSYITYRDGKAFKGATDGERLGGWVPTDEGLSALEEVDA